MSIFDDDRGRGGQPRGGSGADAPRRASGGEGGGADAPRRPPVWANWARRCRDGSSRRTPQPGSPQALQHGVRGAAATARDLSETCPPTTPARPAGRRRRSSCPDAPATRRDHPPEHPGDGGRHGDLTFRACHRNRFPRLRALRVRWGLETVDHAHHLVGRDHLTDAAHHPSHPGRRRVQHELGRAAGDQPRHARVGQRRPRRDDPPEFVPAHRLDHFCGSRPRR